MRQNGIMNLRLLIPVALAGFTGVAATPPAVQTRGGAWHSGGSPLLLSQSDPGKDETAAWLTPTGAGPCWRGVLEAGPYPGRTGLYCGTDAAGAGGVAVELNGGDTPALVLRDPAGKVLWQDAGVGWYLYTPVWLETIVEAGRVRAQMLAADGKELLAQSPWVASSTAPGAAAAGLAAFTAGNTARFTFLQRAVTPLAEVTPTTRRRYAFRADGRWLVAARAHGAEELQPPGGAADTDRRTRRRCRRLRPATAPALSHPPAAALRRRHAAS